ncbi:MAG TPA: hypothetical protein VJ729_08080 [Nitrososphaeraceae archaeon]|jgi:endonuclease G|nr:hypothetical protein [Nitrososphaeraceae archaeon]
MQSKRQIEQKAKDVLATQRDELKKKYSVDSTGIGYKIRNGKLTDTIAIIFYVKRKKTTEELMSEGITPIPAEIEGIPTDVISIPKGFRPRQSDINDEHS